MTTYPSGDPAIGDMKTGKEAEGCGIRMCDEHHAEITKVLDEGGVPYAKTEEELLLKVQSKQPDALFETTRIIMTVGLKVMGSVELLKFGCPMCAIRGFDFIGQTAALVGERIKKSGSVIITPPEKPRIQLLNS